MKCHGNNIPHFLFTCKNNPLFSRFHMGIPTFIKMPTAHTSVQHFFLVLFFIKCFENFPKDLKIYGKDCVEGTSKSLRETLFSQYQCLN